MFAEIDAILFDLGGTLVDYPSPSWPEAATRCLRGLYAFVVRPEHEQPPRIAAVPDARRAHALRGPLRPGTHPLHRLMLALRRVVRGLSGRSLPRLAEACARPLLASGRLYDDAMPTILALEQRGYRLGIVSNTPWGTPGYLWEGQVERFGLTPHFPVRCFSSVVGYCKPDARIFRAALAQAGADAARTLFVGNDPVADIAGAAASGMRTALVIRGCPDFALPPQEHACAKPGGAPSRTGTWQARPDICVRALPQLLDYLPGPSGCGENR